MAACPYCAEEIPQNVTVCPHCRSELKGGAARAGTGPKPAGKSNSTNVIIIVLAVCLGLMLVCGGVLVALLLPAVGAARTAARRSQSQNNLKQIGLAMHNYHDSMGVFPPGSVVDEEGKAHHGWQAMILPYLEQAAMYNRIDFNVPWDDPANSSMGAIVIPTFINPALADQMTLPDGNAAAHYAANSLLFFENSSTRMHSITDGTSNTFMVGEVKENFKAWADPTNVRDPGLGLNTSPDGFGSPFPGGANMLMMDGAVFFISDNIDPDVFKALGTPNGGEAASPY